MSEWFEITNAEEFADYDSEQVYQWLVDLHKEYTLEDITEILELFVDMELSEHYLAVKRFQAHYLKK